MLQEFIDYLEEQVTNHSIYIWGAQGQSYPTVCESWIKAKESGLNRTRALNTYRKAVKAGYQKKLKAFDCSGLGVYFLYNLKKLISGDKTANGLKGMCASISKKELKKGDWVFKTYSNGKAYHIGYVVDDSLNVIEAQGRAYGVVKRSLSKGGWNAFGRPKIFKSEIEKTWTCARNLKRTTPLMSGDDVLAMKQALLAKGYLSSAKKKTFGDDTEKAVKAFQKAKGLTVDGIAGKKTITALGGIWKG